MLKFTSINKENPSKVDPRPDQQILMKYANFAKQKAEEQASRCSQWRSFLPGSLPASNNIPDGLN